MNTVFQQARSRRVLVVDDETDIADVVQVNLEASGYEVTVARNGRQALHKYDVAHPDLVLLDLMLPDISGFHVLARLRRFSRVPVVILTVKGDPDDAAKGLELGADDYMAKPFHVRELLARVSAVLRRVRGDDSDLGPAEWDGFYDDGHIAVDVSRRHVTTGGRPVQLTPIEFEVLALLVANRDRVVGHDEVLARVWGPEYIGNRHYLRVVVARLRQKLGQEGDRIITIPWVGYEFASGNDGNGGGAEQ